MEIAIKSDKMETQKTVAKSNSSKTKTPTNGEKIPRTPVKLR